jgi:hypothetical protein
MGGQALSRLTFYFPMSFVNSAFLWALPVGAIPIIIYYLMRFRSLKVVWGANYVLERALERLKKRLPLEQLILIALRVLACLVVVLLFARPVSSKRTAFVSSTGVHRVIVVDASYSMLAGNKDQTRWDRAKLTLKSLAQTWGRGEKWSLYLLGEKPDWVVDAAAIESPEKTARIIDGLSVGECKALIGKGLEVVAQRLAKEPIELYLAADDQELSWEGADQVSLPQQWPRRVYWIHPPIEKRENLAVTSVRFANERTLVKHPSRLFVAVRNFGAGPVQDADVEILLDGAFYGRERISLLPGQEGTIHLDVVFDEPGSHYVTARLKDDALDFDNRMSAGMEVAGKVKVLVVRAPGRKGKFDSAWSFLEVAGRVEAMADENDEPLFSMGPVVFAPDEGELKPDALASADVVLFDGGSPLSPEVAVKLGDFVSNGGGLVLAADETVDVAQWNEQFGRAKLIPAPLKKLVVEALGGKRFKTLMRSEFEDPAFRPFETEEDGDWANAKFFSWCDLGEIPDSSAVLARFSDRKPFLVRKRSQLGNVVLMAAGLNGLGNNLIVREFYLPLIFRLFSEAASGGIYPRTVALGEPIALRLRDAEGIKGMSLAIEGREPVALSPRERDGEIRAVAPQGSPVTGLCSILVVRSDGSSRVFFGVQGERMDSDLTAMSAAQKATIAEKLGLVEVPDWQQLDEMLKADRSGSEWHHWVALLLLLVLFGEMLMELRFV